MKKLITLLSLAILTISCSKDDVSAPLPPAVIAQPTFALKGLFKMDTSFSSNDENFLFENNKLFVGNEAGTIHQTVSTGSNLQNDAVAFSYDASTNKLTFTYLSRKWEANYEPTTGKIINGVVKASNNITVLGTFTGQKYIPTTSGANLFIGHWKGKYGNGSAVPNISFNLIIENGKAIVIDGFENTLDCDLSSRYGLTTSDITTTDQFLLINYKYSGIDSFYINANYNSETKKLEGIWQSNNTSSGGIVIFEPQNLN